MFDRHITCKFINALEHTLYGGIRVCTPDGKENAFEGTELGPKATIYINDWRAIPLFARKGDIGFAEGYRDGWWDSPDPAALIEFGLRNEQAINSYIYGGFLGEMGARLMNVLTGNSISGSRRNIHAHYDLGNEFYALWLDPTMTYSSALFNHKEEKLVNAQHNKYDRILEKLRGSGSLLEIGCGWGGFAERALEKRDYAYKGITLSSEQHQYASARLGQGPRVCLEDYRTQQGKFDYIVSIEMFEAVGERYWPVYFSRLRSLLAQKGKAVLQTITIGEDYFQRYRKSGDAIRAFIFPGGMLPSSSAFSKEAEKAGLRVSDRFAFGGDYARTLEHWHNQFELKKPEVKALGFDERFIRLWRYYLTCCIASFKAGRTDVMQMELQHA